MTKKFNPSDDRIIQFGSIWQRLNLLSRCLVFKKEVTDASLKESPKQKNQFSHQSYLKKGVLRILELLSWKTENQGDFLLPIDFFTDDQSLNIICSSLVGVLAPVLTRYIEELNFELLDVEFTQEVIQKLSSWLADPNSEHALSIICNEDVTTLCNCVISLTTSNPFLYSEILI